MPRDITAGVETELGADSCHPFYLYQITVADKTTLVETTFYLTAYSRDLVWGGNTYVGGLVMGHSDIEETIDQLETSCSVTLSGVDQTFISAFLNYDYLERSLVIYQGFIDESDYQIVTDPFKIFGGLMDAPNINEDVDTGLCTITVQASSHPYNMGRRMGRHTNDAEQQYYFPGDRGMEHAATIIHEIRWGARG